MAREEISRQSATASHKRQAVEDDLKTPPATTPISNPSLQHTDIHILDLSTTAPTTQWCKHKTSHLRHASTLLP